MSSNGSLSYKSGSVYNELRLTRELSDAVIVVDKVEFHIHKIILCNSSLYFVELFQRWSTPDQKVYVINDLTPPLMQLLIDFAYTGSVSVSEDNVKDLLIAADKFDIPGIIQTCSDFLTKQLRPENCISIWQFSKNCHTPELQLNAYQYILYHFDAVAKCYELGQLSMKDFCDILERDDLFVKENAVYEAILHWTAHAPGERAKNMPMLLAKVRLALTTQEFIINVLTNQLVRTSSKCLDIVSFAARVMRHMKANSVSGYCNLVARPRLPSAILLAIGGWSDASPTHLIEAYDLQADCWDYLVDHMQHPRAYCGAVFLNDSIYCIGGYDGAEHYNTVSRFDLNERIWQEVAPMHSRRCYVSVTVLKGCIYAIGGYDGRIRLKTAECYTPETNQWTLIASMHEHRSNASCTTLKDKLYICGGFNGNEFLQTAEYYSPETNEWTVMAPMNSRRSGIGVIGCADHVYAVGGYDGDDRLASAEAYNPQTNNWMWLPSMQCARSNFGIEVVEDRLFVAGGFSGVSTTNHVEYYDLTTGLWSPARSMRISRNALSCCVMSGFRNVTQYAMLRNNFPELLLEDDLEMEDL
ncbi:kelch-like protein 10 [Corythoichthys intestinalis]|uniref:kelch-like protein 10 n=1 Tax=Corythoichthys intestinalis TaxID=161448 RepID=UPI0025A6704C|nr:kelch-like protein 10 [Corythoichthys intestinalis]XP_061795314.1 kelch-like protein 10 [Nerophis lumbriciformis]